MVHTCVCVRLLLYGRFSIVPFSAMGPFRCVYIQFSQLLFFHANRLVKEQTKQVQSKALVSTLSVYSFAPFSSFPLAYIWVWPARSVDTAFRLLFLMPEEITAFFRYTFCLRAVSSSSPLSPSHRSTISVVKLLPKAVIGRLANIEGRF